MSEPCPHEAWEVTGLDARRCADCREYLPDAKPTTPTPDLEAKARELALRLDREVRNEDYASAILAAFREVQREALERVALLAERWAHELAYNPAAMPYTADTLRKFAAAIREENR